MGQRSASLMTASLAFSSPGVVGGERNTWQRWQSHRQLAGQAQRLSYIGHVPELAGLRR